MSTSTPIPTLALEANTAADASAVATAAGTTAANTRADDLVGAAAGTTAANTGADDLVSTAAGTTATNAGADDLVDTAAGTIAATTQKVRKYGNASGAAAAAGITAVTKKVRNDGNASGAAAAQHHPQNGHGGHGARGGARGGHGGFGPVPSYRQIEQENERFAAGGAAASAAQHHPQNFRGGRGGHGGARPVPSYNQDDTASDDEDFGTIQRPFVPHHPKNVAGAAAAQRHQHFGGARGGRGGYGPGPSYRQIEQENERFAAGGAAASARDEDDETTQLPAVHRQPKLCRNDPNCMNPECWFAHPSRAAASTSASASASAPVASNRYLLTQQRVEFNRVTRLCQEDLGRLAFGQNRQGPSIAMVMADLPEGGCSYELTKAGCTNPDCKLVHVLQVVEHLMELHLYRNTKP
jgi:hypothetical protein